MGFTIGIFVFIFILILVIFISFIYAVVKSIKLCGIESIIHIIIMFIFYPYVIIFLIAGKSICNKRDRYNNRSTNRRYYNNNRNMHRRNMHRRDRYNNNRRMNKGEKLKLN